MSSPRLLDQVRDRLRVKHYSMRTEDTYLQWIRRFIFFHGKKHPREMGGPQVDRPWLDGVVHAKPWCRRGRLLWNGMQARRLRYISYFTFIPG